MVPEVAFVEVNASVMFEVEPAVMVAGVAVKVAVGTGGGLPPPVLFEDEPPQLASTNVNAKSNAEKRARQNGLRLVKLTKMMASPIRFPQLWCSCPAVENLVCVQETTLPAQESVQQWYQRGNFLESDNSLVPDGTEEL
jgi:hypothetical protein